MQIRPTAFTIGLIIHFSIALFSVYTEFGIDSDLPNSTRVASSLILHMMFIMFYQILTMI